MSDPTAEEVKHAPVETHGEYCAWCIHGEDFHEAQVAPLYRIVESK